MSRLGGDVEIYANVLVAEDFGAHPDPRASERPIPSDESVERSINILAAILRSLHDAARAALRFGP